ncbi:MAG: winged helix-turn-helix domain-containing protein [bacterium]|nr:winged helix-turn-helix domain-containing protein [bacterium]
METLSVREARRLALARAGLLDPRWTGLPGRASGRGKRARAGAHAVMRRFGYLQLDTVSIAGARSHGIVLLSRLGGMDYRLPEELLQPGEPIFEYWGHEACWLPMELFPVFAFRRREFREHPWWGDVVGENPRVADDLLVRIRDEGPLRSVDLEGRGSRGWWDLKVAKKVASQLWSSGVLAIRERKNFQRSYDLIERVIPAEVLDREEPFPSALKTLLLRALAGHGWAQTGTLAATWRLRNLRTEIAIALEELREEGAITPCALATRDGRHLQGWIRPEDLELAVRLKRIRPRKDQGVLLSPFDPVLWDRPRVKTLFDFDQVLEIFKPAPQRIYGYYCLPVLAGDRLVARYDLKADRKSGVLNVLSRHLEDPAPPGAREATRSALARYAAALKLKPSSR